MAKRIVDVECAWRAAKKPCYRSGSGSSSTATSSNIPELSSLLFSLPPHLLVSKHHRHDTRDHHDLKRPRYGSDALEAQMRGLTIRCATDKEDMLRSTEEEDEEKGDRWSSFLPELLRLVCCRLPLPDAPRFSAVCKNWNSCAFPVYPADAAPVLISSTVADTGLIRCYSPYFNKMFVLSTPLRAPESRIFAAAADGWVIFRRPNKTILFGNILDGSTFETPECKYKDGFFLRMPKDDGHGHPKDCGMFGVYASNGTVRIQSWDGESWEGFEFGGGDDNDDDDDDNNDGDDDDADADDDNGGDDDADADYDNDGDDDDIADEEQEEDDMEGDDLMRRQFTMSICCNPVLHKGLVYCLGKEGSLGVYDPTEIKWSVLRKPTSFGSDFAYKNCYLVESQGELLAALTGKDGTPIYVLRLNETEMAWERMESLGGRALFIGTVASLLVAKPAETMANKVYLPRFYGRPQVIQAELTNSGGRLFFAIKPNQGLDEPPSDRAGMAWCYDLELDSGVDKQFAGCKKLLQYVWVQLGLAASPFIEMG